MFEKEAEEYFENECLHSYADTEEQLKEDVVPAFQKGAEFGYNKCKEEIDYLNKHWRSEEERKANKWHDLEKDPKDLPKDKHDVWCKWLDLYSEGWYDKDTNTWTILYRDYHLHSIEAWCELPRFD